MMLNCSKKLTAGTTLLYVSKWSTEGDTREQKEFVGPPLEITKPLKTLNFS